MLFKGAYIWLPAIDTYVHDVQNSNPRSKQRNFFYWQTCVYLQTDII